MNQTSRTLTRSNYRCRSPRSHRGKDSQAATRITDSLHKAGLAKNAYIKLSGTARTATAKSYLRRYPVRTTRQNYTYDMSTSPTQQPPNNISPPVVVNPLILNSQPIAPNLSHTFYPLRNHDHRVLLIVRNRSVARQRHRPVEHLDFDLGPGHARLCREIGSYFRLDPLVRHCWLLICFSLLVRRSFFFGGLLGWVCGTRKSGRFSVRGLVVFFFFGWRLLSNAGVSYVEGESVVERLFSFCPDFKE